MGTISYYILNDAKQEINQIDSVVLDYEGFKKIGNSSSYDDMMNTVLKQMPKIIFLNIDIIKPHLLDVLAEITKYSSQIPEVVALSSTTSRAYEAIKNHFFDYLLTPLSELELRKTIMRYRKKFDKESKKTICIKSYKDYRYINTDEILFLKADNNTTDFHTLDKTVISAYKTLKTFENILPDNFLRIHKSYIINKDFVSRIQFGKSVCTIKSHTFHIPFTKTYIENILLINKTLEESSYLSLN